MLEDERNMKIVKMEEKITEEEKKKQRMNALSILDERKTEIRKMAEEITEEGKRRKMSRLSLLKR